MNNRMLRSPAPEGAGAFTRMAVELNPWAIDPKAIYWHRTDGRRTQSLGMSELIYKKVAGAAMSKAMDIAFDVGDSISMQDIRDMVSETLDVNA